MDFDYGLLAKYINNQLTQAEAEEVERWRDLSAENTCIFSELVRLRISWQYMKYNNTERIDKAWICLNQRMDRARRHTLLFNLLRYAATLLLLLSLSYGGYELFKPEKFVKIVVGSGAGIKKVKLADGTTIWLKESSVLKVPESFSGRKRNISLTGSAYFDVAKSVTPFYISTGYVNVGVYGTVFELAVDDEAKKVEATLVRGEIALLNRNWEAVLDIRPGEKVTYDYTHNQYTTEQVDVNVCAVWRFDQFVFKNESLREITNLLSQKFNVRIVIKSPLLAQRRFRCVINKDESLADILELLKLLAPIDYSIGDTGIIITEKCN